MPSTGDLTAELVDAALEVGHDKLLAVALQPARLQFELEAFLLEPGRLHARGRASASTRPARRVARW